MTKTSKTRLLALVSAVAAIVVASCSTAPPPREFVTDTRDRGYEYLDQGNSMFAEGRFEDAQSVLELSRTEFASIDYRVGLVEAHNALAKLYMAYGRYDTALTELRTAEEIASRLEDNRLLLLTSANKAERLLRLRDYDAVIELLDDAAPYLTDLEQSQEAAVYYHNYGSAENRVGSLDVARDYLDRALAINLELRNYTEAAANYYQLAGMLSRADQTDEALEFARLALEYDKRMENSIGIGNDLYALGAISQKVGDLRAALSYYQRSLRVFVAVEIVPDTMRLLAACAEVAEALGNSDLAEAYRDELSEMEQREAQ